VSAQEEDYQTSLYSLSVVSPRGLTIDPNTGSLVVASLGTGNQDSSVARLTDLNGDGMADNGAEVRTIINGLPSHVIFIDDAPEIIGASGVSVDANGEVYVVTGQNLADPLHDSQFNAVWSTAAENTSGNPFRVANPYASLGIAEWTQNPDGNQLDTNGFGIVVMDDGTAYVNDAGANATWMVATDGTVTPFAVYPDFPNPTDFGPPFVNMVPTGLAVGPDGALYVSFLTGFPFLEGASMVYRLEDLDGDGDAMEAGEMEVYAEGLTTSTAIAFDADGNLYSTEFRGFLLGGPMNTGRVVMWDGSDWHVISDGLTSPTGLTVGWDGTIFVTQEFVGQIMAITPAAGE
jgi:hypothetical protein